MNDNSSRVHLVRQSKRRIAVRQGAALALVLMGVALGPTASADGPFSWDGIISAGTDDAEQLGSGAMRLANSDLELVVKQGDVQQVGLRFTNVQIPAGATIDSAYLQFRANGVSTGPLAVTIKTENSVNPPTFAFGTGNISNRPTGQQSVSWSPPS